MRFRTLLLSVALIAPLAVAAETAHEASASFHHSESDLQPHASGVLGIRSGPEFERFSLVVEGVSEASALTVLMGDGHDHFAEIGNLPAGLSRREFVRTTLEGGHLPFDAAHAGDLSGRGVRIVDGESHLILFGEVPQIIVEAPPPVVPPPAPVVTRAWFMRPDGAPFPEARGLTVVSRDGHIDGLRFEVDRLGADSGYVAYVVGADGEIVFGDFHTNGLGGGEIRRQAERGEPLGGGLPALSELFGRRLEIRDLAGDVVLYGAIPEAEDVHDADPVREHVEAHDATSGADVRVVCEIHPDRGHERFRMEMHDLPHERQHADGDDDGDAAGDDGSDDGAGDSAGGDDPAGDGSGDAAGGDAAGGDASGGDRPAGDARRARRRPAADVFMDDGTGTLEQVASVRIDRRGNARLRYTTRRGRSLPLGVASLRELSGRAFEVRVNGVRAVGGNLPNM